MKNLKIAIRLDDICDTMNWTNFNKVMDICEKYNVKPLLGIVPINKDKKLMIESPNNGFYSQMLKLQQDGVIFAQHGYDHVYTNKNGGILKLNKQSDFVGKPLETQMEFIAKGKSMLEDNGINTDIYMAPSHSYDKNTIIALKKLGFKYVTDGYTNFNYVWKGLIFVPCKNTFVLKRKDKGLITLCLHINTMNNKDMEQFEKTLNDNKDCLMNYSDIINEKPKKHFRLQQKFNLFATKLKIKIAKMIKRR